VCIFVNATCAGDTDQFIIDDRVCCSTGLYVRVWGRKFRRYNKRIIFVRTNFPVEKKIVSTYIDRSQVNRGKIV